MTFDEKDKTRRMRERGWSYGKIAKDLGVSENTIKSFCRREGIYIHTDQNTCEQCSREIAPHIGGQKRRFCSDKCRYKWNYSHRLMDESNAVQKVCECCGKTVYVYPSANRKYCSHRCYIDFRYNRRNACDI